MLLRFEEKPEGTSVLGEIDIDTTQGKERFNPMKSWMKAGKLLDQYLDNPFDQYMGDDLTQPRPDQPPQTFGAPPDFQARGGPDAPMQDANPSFYPNQTGPENPTCVKNSRTFLNTINIVVLINLDAY